MKRPILIVALLLMVCSILFTPAYAERGMDPTLEEETVVTAEPVEQSAIREAVYNELKKYPDYVIDQDNFVISSLRIEKDWAIGSISITETTTIDPDQPDDHKHAEPMISRMFLATNMSGTWQAALEETDRFIAFLQAAPDYIISEEAKNILLKSYDPNRMNTVVNYKFPFAGSWQWTNTNGWHGTAIDIGTSDDPRLLSAANGVVQENVPCAISAYVTVRHEDGQILRYFHIDKTRVGTNLYSGALVKQGQYLGTLLPDTWNDGSCGYTNQTPTFAHVHLDIPTIYQTGSITFDGWTIKAGQNLFVKGTESKRILDYLPSSNTENNQAPSTPLLSAPTHNSKLYNRSVNFRWQASTDPEHSVLSYKVRYWNSGTPQSPYISNATTATNISVTLPADGHFCWQVQANDGSKTSSWSGVWCFTVYSVKRNIDNPVAEGVFVQGTIRISGWACHPTPTSTGTGISAVHIYRDGQAGTGVWVGTATYGIERADVATKIDERCRYSGYSYSFNASTLSPGPHTFYVYVYSTTTNSWTLDTRKFYIIPPSTACSRPLYRYWHQLTKQHFYTANFEELRTGSNGWVYEGVVGYVASNATCYAPGAIPLYRLHHATFGEQHLYTTNLAEKESLERNGWVYEGITGYVLSAANSTYNTTALYRLYNRTTYDHFYTSNKSEFDSAQTQGYQSEGVQAYIFNKLK